METKKKDFVSIMKDMIIQASIESLRQEGLKFSLDVLANKLKISKKTVYKYFPNKEALAMALYEKYYSDVSDKAAALINQNSDTAHNELLRVYLDSKIMTYSDIFNKYKLNKTIYSYIENKSNFLWEIIASSFGDEKPETEIKALRIIVDGSFEKLCCSDLSPNYVIERLVSLLW